MNAQSQATTGVRVIGPGEGEITKDVQGTRSDRYLIDRVDSGGGFSLVEHTIEPHVLAAPLHLHTREDEYSFVLEGRLGALLGDEEVFAEAGTLVFKPRGQWHTFWNAGDVPLRLLEMISPGGIEELFRKLGEPGGEYDPETLPALVAGWGCEVDFEKTMPIAERHQLIF
jgi:mannose-6-phosphate isomerase-like protein (cupin superfamily)